MSHSKPISARLWVPVDKCATGYVVARDWAGGLLEPIPEEFIYAEESGEVTMAFDHVAMCGHSYPATILLPGSDVDAAYVLVDEHGIPRAIEESKHGADTSDIDTYYANIRQSLNVAEGILPEQKCYLWTEFIQPNIERSYRSQALHHWQVSKEASRVLVVGAAGSGKTTLLRRCVLDLADQHDADAAPVIPVYVQLRDWHESRSVDRLVRREFARWSTGSFLKRLDVFSGSGLVVFFFDGIDEIARELRQNAISDISQFVEAHSRSRFVISGRPGGYLRDMEPDFVRLECKPWTESQVQEYCSQKLHGHTHSWLSYWNRMDAEPEIKDLGQNPLILSFLVGRYIRDSLSPHYVSEVIDAITEILIDEWDSVRGIRRSLHSQSTPKKKLSLLKHVARSLVRESKTVMTLEDFCRITEDMSWQDSPTDTLRALEEETGLIEKASGDTWSFLHVAVQEWLAASFEVESYVADAAKNLADAGRSTSRIWRYMCWLASDATKLLRKRAEQPYSVSSASALAEALSQNLLVERSTIEGYVLCVEKVLERLLDRCTILEARAEDELEDHRVVFRLPENIDSPLERADGIAKMFSALSNARDGVGADEVSNRLSHSDNENLRLVSGILALDGKLVCETRKTDSGMLALIYVNMPIKSGD